jgi:hypothetical protein
VVAEACAIAASGEAAMVVVMVPLLLTLLLHGVRVVDAWWR